MKNIRVKQRKDNYLMVLASIMMIVAIVMGGLFSYGNNLTAVYAEAELSLAQAAK